MLNTKVSFYHACEANKAVLSWTKNGFIPQFRGQNTFIQYFYKMENPFQQGKLKKQIENFS